MITAASQGIWMAGLQGAVVLGIVAGYVTTGVFVTKWLPMVCPARDQSLIDEGIIDTSRASIDLTALTKEQVTSLQLRNLLPLIVMSRYFSDKWLVVVGCCLQRLELSGLGKNFTALAGGDGGAE